MSPFLRAKLAGQPFARRRSFLPQASFHLLWSAKPEGGRLPKILSPDKTISKLPSPSITTKAMWSGGERLHPGARRKIQSPQAPGWNNLPLRAGPASLVGILGTVGVHSGAKPLTNLTEKWALTGQGQSERSQSGDLAEAGAHFFPLVLSG